VFFFFFFQKKTPLYSFLLFCLLSISSIGHPPINQQNDGWDGLCGFFFLVRHLPGDISDHFPTVPYYSRTVSCWDLRHRARTQPTTIMAVHPRVSRKHTLWMDEWMCHGRNLVCTRTNGQRWNRIIIIHMPGTLVFSWLAGDRGGIDGQTHSTKGKRDSRLKARGGYGDIQMDNANGAWASIFSFLLSYFCFFPFLLFLWFASFSSSVTPTKSNLYSPICTSASNLPYHSLTIPNHSNGHPSS